jgi:hypothetical protein
MTAALPIEFLCAFPLWEIRFGALGQSQHHRQESTVVGTGNDQQGFGWAGWLILAVIYR